MESNNFENDLTNKLRRKKNLEESCSNQPDLVDNYDNYQIDLILNPINLVYGSFIKYLLLPDILAAFISFFGAYILVSFNFLIGLLVILFSFFIAQFLNCLEDKYFIFSNEIGDLDKVQKYDINKICFSKEELLFLQSSLPWHLCEAEIESTKWLNSIIEKVWLQIQKQFDNWLDKQYGKERKLDQLLGKGNCLLDLKIVNSNLGNSPITISGVRMIKHGIKKEDAILECEIIFDLHSKVEINGRYSIKIGLQKFYFKSKLRIIAENLFRELPVISSINLYLIEYPQIDWSFTDCQPLRTKLNVAKFLPMRELKQKDPIELIKLDLVEAQNLPNELNICCTTKRSSTYCLISIDNNEKCSKIRKETNNPVEQTEEDELIAYAKVNVKNFKIKKTELNGREFEVQLTNPETKMPIKCGQTKLIFRISWFKLTDNLNKINKSFEWSKSKLPVACLLVLVDSCSGLETVVHTQQTPELRTLVRITVGNQVKVTSIKQRTAYPIFDSELEFFIFNPQLEDLLIEIVDIYWVMEKRFNEMVLSGKKELNLSSLVDLSFEGVLLGYVNIRTADILNNFQMKKQGTFQLSGYSEEASIRLVLTIRLIEFSKSINENLSLPRIKFEEK